MTLNIKINNYCKGNLHVYTENKKHNEIISKQNLIDIREVLLAVSKMDFDSELKEKHKSLYFKINDLLRELYDEQ